MNKHKLSIILHGPYSGNAYVEIFDSLKPLKDRIDKIIISTYVADMAKTDLLITQYEHIYNIIKIYNKDIINPGYFNLNRQVLTVQKALDEIDDNSIVVKLRNDQWCKMNDLYKIVLHVFANKFEDHKIITTNCFTRKDRLYHPSDMFLCGYKEELKEYYSLPLQKLSHLNYQLMMIKKLKYTNESFEKLLISPESELFKNYLLRRGWNLKYTFSDSYNAIKQYMLVINTWDINLRWNKQRNAFLPAKTIILPYSFTMAPFEGAPAEMAVCYSRHNFYGHKKLRDWWYINYARLVFSMKYNRIHRVIIKIKNKVPRFVLEHLSHSKFGQWLKSII